LLLLVKLLANIYIKNFFNKDAMEDLCEMIAWIIVNLGKNND